MHYKVKDEITYSFSNSQPLKFWERRGNSIPHFRWTHDYLSMLGSELIHISNRGPSPQTTEHPVNHKALTTHMCHHDVHSNEQSTAQPSIHTTVMSLNCPGGWPMWVPPVDFITMLAGLPALLCQCVNLTVSTTWWINNIYVKCVLDTR